MSSKKDAVAQRLEEASHALVHKSFLGGEFLTWLWYFSEGSEEELFYLDPQKKKRKARVWVDNRLAFRSSRGASQDQILRGEAPSRCDLSTLALQLGKTVRELRLGVEVESVGTFYMTLDERSLAPKSVELPEADPESDENPVEQRLQNTLHVACLYDQLTSQFLSDRTSDVWENKYLAAIRSWIQSKARDREHYIH